MAVTHNNISDALAALRKPEDEGRSFAEREAAKLAAEKAANNKAMEKSAQAAEKQEEKQNLIEKKTGYSGYVTRGIVPSGGLAL